jgi:phosphohistidine phosphatase
MKFLTILRHAKSSWAEPGEPDRERGLNERGKKAIPLVGGFLKKKAGTPDLVYSSPARRALKTAEGITAIIGYPKDKITVEEAIYSGSDRDILELIRKTDAKVDDLFLFGHEPKLSSLINCLTGEALEKFPTCSAYRIRIDGSDWKLVKPGSSKCEFFVNPKLLGEK